MGGWRTMTMTVYKAMKLSRGLSSGSRLHLLPRCISQSTQQKQERNNGRSFAMSSLANFAKGEIEGGEEGEEGEEDDEEGNVDAGGGVVRSFNLTKVIHLANKLVNLKNSESAKVIEIIEEWKKCGNAVNKSTVLYLMNRLKARHRFKHALELAEWMKNSSSVGDGKDKIRYFELIGRGGFVGKARELFDELSDDEKSEEAYNSMLLVYSKAGFLYAAEELFNELKEKKMITSAYALSLMACLYNKKKMTNKVMGLLDTAKEFDIMSDCCFKTNVLPAIAAVKGIEAAEELYEEIVSSSDSNNRPVLTYFTMASCYVEAQQKEKAEKLLEEVENRMKNGKYGKTKMSYVVLITMYASIGNVEAMERIWSCLMMGLDDEMPCSDYCCMIRSLGKVGEIEKGEKYFEEARSKGMKEPSLFNAMLFVYAMGGAPEKCEALRFKMEGMMNMKLDAWGYNHMIWAYLKKDEKEKAISYLKTNMAAAKINRRLVPIESSLVMVLRSIGDDVDRAEKLFSEWERNGWKLSVPLFNTLLDVYNNAKMICFGFVERMSAAKLKPNLMTQQLLLKQKELE